MKSIGLVESERRINNHTTLEHRYYLLTIQSDAQLFAQAVLSHYLTQVLIFSLIRSKEMCAFALEITCKNGIIMVSIIFGLITILPCLKLYLFTCSLAPYADAGSRLCLYFLSVPLAISTPLVTYP